MTPEVIATLIASFGAIMAALYGIHRASGGKAEAASSPAPAATNVANMMDQYLARLQEIERGIIAAVATLQDIRRALEGTGHRQEKMVEELETMARSMARIEGAQGQGANVFASMKHHEDMQVQILAQIREEIKGLREARLPRHRTDS